MLEHSYQTLPEAMLQTVAYSDIFDYPLSAPEIHRYLTGVKASIEEVTTDLQSNSMLRKEGDYYFLPGREKILDIRLGRERRSRQLLPLALQYGRILGALPFIRMVALTGSLAVMNVSGDEDFDYMLITVPGRVWTARAFALLLNRMMKVFGHTICPNLIISENNIAWSQHDLYTARELCQMVPISGMDVYQKLMKANAWVAEFLPNAYMESIGSPADTQKQASALQSTLEFLLRSKFGDRLESWEMNRKIERFSRQEGFGEETIFNADICQGNFDHHSEWTRRELEAKLIALAAASREASLKGSEYPGHQVLSPRNHSARPAMGADES